METDSLSVSIRMGKFLLLKEWGVMGNSNEETKDKESTWFRVVMLLLKLLLIALIWFGAALMIAISIHPKFGKLVSIVFLAVPIFISYTVMKKETFVAQYKDALEKPVTINEGSLKRQPIYETIAKFTAKWDNGFTLLFYVAFSFIFVFLPVISKPWRIILRAP